MALLKETRRDAHDGGFTVGGAWPTSAGITSPNKPLRWITRRQLLRLKCGRSSLIREMDLAHTLLQPVRHSGFATVQCAHPRHVTTMRSSAPINRPTSILTWNFAGLPIPNRMVSRWCERCARRFARPWRPTMVKPALFA